MENGSHARVEYGREGWGIDIDQNFEEFFKDCQPKYSFQHKPYLNPIELEISDNIFVLKKFLIIIAKTIKEKNII